MGQIRTCPERTRWEQFLANEIDPVDEAELESHLDECESCRDQLVLLTEWPSAATPTSTPVGGEPRSWLDRLADLEPSSIPATGGESVAAPRLPGFDDFEEIGRGGMGIVYRAHQVGLDRTVAIKVLSSAGRLAPWARVRAAREARALARLNHPNVVRIHDVGETDGLSYIVMEWAEEGDLADRLATGPLPPREAAVLMRAIALAVAAAYRRGIIHRDIKPRNILLAADGSPRLTDFGLAREVDSANSLTSMGLAIGTPGYMAPEQVEPALGPVGMLADVYALGATFYTMLTGRPPFQAASEAELLRQLVEREPVPPRGLDDAIPRDLDTICRKCLEKQPARRYDSADALAADLERFLEGRPIQARPTGPIESLWRRSRRHPTIAALAALVAMLLLAMILGSVLFARRQAQLRQIAEAGTDHARRVLDVMARGMEASSKAIRTMNASSQPELRRLFTKHLNDVAAIYDGYFQERPTGTPWLPSEVQMLGELAELRGLQGREEDSERLRR